MYCCTVSFCPFTSITSCTSPSWLPITPDSVHATAAHTFQYKGHLSFSGHAACRQAKLLHRHESSSRHELPHRLSEVEVVIVFFWLLLHAFPARRQGASCRRLEAAEVVIICCKYAPICWRCLRQKRELSKTAHRMGAYLQHLTSKTPVQVDSVAQGNILQENFMSTGLTWVQVAVPLPPDRHPLQPSTAKSSAWPSNGIITEQCRHPRTSLHRGQRRNVPEQSRENIAWFPGEETGVFLSRRCSMAHD